MKNIEKISLWYKKKKMMKFPLLKDDSTCLSSHLSARSFVHKSKYLLTEIFLSMLCKFLPGTTESGEETRSSLSDWEDFKGKRILCCKSGFFLLLCSKTMRIGKISSFIASSFLASLIIFKSDIELTRCHDDDQDLYGVSPPALVLDDFFFYYEKKMFYLS